MKDQVEFWHSLLGTLTPNRPNDPQHQQFAMKYGRGGRGREGRDVVRAGGRPAEVVEIRGNLSC